MELLTLPDSLPFPTFFATFLNAGTSPPPSEGFGREAGSGASRPSRAPAVPGCAGEAQSTLGLSHVLTRVRFLSAVKPTVIDVDIYVNSIGPVSSINMVRPGSSLTERPLVRLSPSAAGLGCGFKTHTDFIGRFGLKW